MEKKLLLIGLLLFTISNGISQTSSIALNTVMDNIREKYNIAEISAAVIKTDEIHYAISGVPEGIKTDTEILKSKMHLGSISKTITSLIASKMVADGKITFDTTLGSIIPELAGKGKANSLTLRDLLTNTSNLSAFDQERDFKRIPDFNGSMSNKMMEFAKIALEKGSGKTFSNAGYVMASLMLEKVGGVPFEDLLRQVIEEDLKLSCFIGVPNKNELLNFWGSWNDSSIQISHFASNPHLNADFMIPAEGISMDIVDYSKIMQLHLNGLLGDSNYLDYASYSKIHYELEEFGYGWQNTIADQSKISFHNTLSNTYFCHVVLIPRQKIGIVLMAQINDPTEVSLIYEIRDILSARYNQ